MPNFSYTALDDSGETQQGFVSEPTMDAAMKRLAERGWQVQALAIAANPGDPLAEQTRPESQRPAPPVTPRSPVQTDLIGPLVGGVALTHLHFMFRQLGTMLNAGIAPAQALDSLSQQSGSGRLKTILAEVREHVNAGRPMTSGFQRYPEVFSPIMMGMVRAGEEGGFLSEQCRMLADYIQRDIEHRNLVRRETFYPKLVFWLSIFIIGGANLVIESLKPGAKGINAPVFLWILFIGVAIAWFFWGRIFLRQPAIRRPWDEMIAGIPWYGPMVHGFAMARFGRAFGAMHEAGLPLGRAVQLSADATGNEAVRARIYPIINKMDSGEGIYETFQASRAFSPVVLDMVRAGEMTGNLNEMLTKVAEYYEDESQTKARQAAMILGATMLLAVGAYVAYVVITFYVGYANDRVSGI